MREKLITSLSTLLRKLVPAHPIPSHPQRILVVKPCCLGDLVFTTPALAALRQRYPQARLDLAVGTWSRAAVEHNPHLDQIIDSETVGQGNYHLGHVWRLARKLRPTRYDMAVVLDRSPLVGMLPWLAGIPHRLGLDSRQRGFAHTCRIPVPSIPRHEAQLYLDVVAATGIPTEQDGQPCFWTEFVPPETDSLALPQIPKPFVLLHPGGGVNPGMQLQQKRWPPERFAALADYLQQVGFTPVFSGTAADVDICRAIQTQMRKAGSIVIAGQTSLAAFGALCRQAALFVGGDTGATHIAAATGCKTLAIFGPSDPRRYAPFAPPDQVQTLWHPFDVPQGGVGQGRQADGFSWQDGVNVQEAWQAACKLLKVNGPDWDD